MNNVANKKYINLNENVIMMSFHKGPLVLNYGCLTEFVLRAKVHSLVFIICLLLVGVDCVTDKLKTTSSLKFQNFLWAECALPLDDSPVVILDERKKF